MSKKKTSFWKKQGPFLKVMLCLLLIFTSIGVSTLVGDVMLTADADDAEVEEVIPEEVLEDDTEEDLTDEEESEEAEEVEEEAQVEEEEPQQEEVISTQDIAPFAADTEVSSWDELKAAVAEPTVSHIILKNNITRTGSASNDLSAIGRNLKISGNGYTIDFQKDSNAAFILARATTATSFELNDVVVANQGCEYLIRQTDNSDASTNNSAYSINWDVKIHNLSHAESTTANSIFKATGSDITLTGNITWNSTSNTHSSGTGSTSGIIVARGFTITEGANVNITARRVIFNSRPYSADTKISMRIDGGSKVNLYSQEEATIWLGKEGRGNSNNVVITGAGTEVYASSNGTGTGNSNAVISFAGTAKEGDDSEDGSDPEEGEIVAGDSLVEISGGAILDVDSKGDGSRAFPGVISQIDGGVFRVTGAGTQMNIKTLGGHNTYGAAFRLRLVGNQTFDVSNNAEVNISKTGTVSRAPAMRFYGQSNSLYVRSGGKIKVYNEGLATDYDPGSNGRNQGIQYTSGGSSSQVFDVSGKGSAIEIISKHGAAVDIAGSGAAKINVSDQAVFIARGQTSSASAAIFNVSNVNFTTDSPLYYDFANTRAAGGLVFKVGSNSTYTSTNSDIAVWKSGSNIEGNPKRSWTLINFDLKGTNFGTIVSTSHEDEFNSTDESFGSKGMGEYSRVNGNNASPVIDELRVPENADKYIYGHAGVPEGFYSDLRDAWSDEVYVILKETSPDGSVREVKAVSYGMSNEDPGVSVYGEAARGGIYVFELEDFAVTGATYEVVRAWRGEADPDKAGARVHEADSSDILTGVVSVIDKTPPIPVEINNTVYTNTTTMNGTWSLDGEHNSDAPVKLTVTLNGVDLGNEGTINADNTWTYSFPAGTTLKENDVVQVFLEDANGNKNPVEDTDYHDALKKDNTQFKGATKTTVKKVPYTIDANNVILGLDDAKLVVSDDDLIDLAKAAAKDVSDGSDTDVVVKSSQFKEEAGTYEVVFAVEKEQSIEKKVTFEVLPYDVVVTNDDYIIAANHITIYRGLADSIEKDSTVASEKLTELTDVTGWKRSDRSEVAVSLDSHTVKGAEGLYAATFKVNNDATVKATVKVKVIIGDAPTITGADDVNIPLNTTFDARDGVTANDTEDGDITSKINIAGTVDTSKKGVYILEYTVTDSDGNKAEETRIVAVGLIEGKDYYFDINNYVILKDDVTGTDSEILDKTGARAWLKSTGAEVAQSDLEVRDNGGYKAEVGEYTVKVSVNGATDEKDVVSAVAKVVTGHVIEEGDNYTIVANNVVMSVEQAQAALADKDSLITTSNARAWKLDDFSAGTVKLEDTTLEAKTGTYAATFYVDEEQTTKVTNIITVKNKDEIESGDDYAIGANNFSVRKGEVASLTDDKLIELAKAEGWTLKDSSSAAVAVTEKKIGTDPAGTDYYVTFHIVDKPSKQVTVKVTVTDGNAPVIKGTDDVNIPLNSTFDERDGVTAEDDEDGDLTADIKIDGTVDTSKKGVYILEYSVEDSDGNKAEETRLVAVGLIEGKDYYFDINNYVILKDDVTGTDGEILDKTGARAWSKTTGLEVAQSDLEVRDNGGYKAVVGDYTVKVSVTGATDEKDVVSAIAKVVTGHVIEEGDNYTIVANNVVMSVEDAKTALADKDSLVTISKAKAWKLEDLSDGTVKLEDTTLKAEEGTYAATFYVDEEKTTKVTNIITVKNKDEIESGDDYAIGANNFTIRKGEVAGLTDDKLIELAKAEGWKLKDSSSAAVAVTEKSIGTDPSATNYYVTFHIVDKPSKTVTIKVKVTDGSGPKIEGTDNVSIPLDTTFDARAGVTASDEEDGDLTADIKIAGTVNTSEKGVYILDYSVTDSDGNKAEEKRIVAVGLIEGKDYYFDINNYVILKDDVTGTNAEILDKTGARAWSKTTGLEVSESDLEVRDNGGYKAVVGDYTVKVSVKGATDEKDVVSAIAKVVNGHVIEEGDKYTIVASNVVMNVDEATAALADKDSLITISKANAWKLDDLSVGTVKLEDTTLEAKTGTYAATFYVDEEQTTKVTNIITVKNKDEIENGDDYAIGANNFSVRKGEVAGLTDEKLISLAKAEGWLLKDMSSVEVAVTEKKISTDVSSTEHYVTFHIVDKPSKTVTVKVKVTDGGAPTIDGADNVSIPLNTAFDERDGVTASDDEDGDLTADIKIDGTVDTSKKGVYILEYSVEDSDGNKAEETRIVAVGLIEGKDYYFDINNYVILKDDVTGTDGEILDKTGARAWSKTTGKEVAQSDLEVRDNGGYKAVVGEYTVKVSVNGATDEKDVVSAIAKVVNGHVIEEGDKYTIVASNVVMNVDEATAALADKDSLITISKANAWKLEDFSAGTVKLDSTTLKAEEGTYAATFYVDEEQTTKVTNVITVKNKDEIENGDDYAIGANNFTVRKGEVAGLTDEKLIELAKAEGWKLKDSSSATVEVTDKLIGTDPSATNYFVTFNIVDKPSKQVTVKVTVSDGSGPKIEGADNVSIPLDTAFDARAGVTASDEEDGDLTADIKIAGTVNTSEKGVYILDYSVTDSDGNKAEEKRIVAVGLIEGKDYYFDINNYVILKDDVTGTNAEILDKTGARAWSKTTGLEVTQENIEVRDNGGYKAVVGDYTVKVSVKGATDEKDVVSAIAKVVNGHVIEEGDKYTIVASNVVMNVDEATAALADKDSLVTISKANAWNLSDLSAGTVKLEDTTLEAKVGTYAATFYVDEEQTTKVTNIITVKNKDEIENGDDYAIGANNFSVRKGEVAGLTDEKLISLAKAEGWLLKDMSSVEVAVTEKKISTDVNATDHYVTFHIVDKPSKTVTVKVKVTDGSGPVIEGTDNASIELNGTFDARAGVTASDVEDGDLTADIEIDGTVDTSTKGVYILEYSVEDSDGNKAEETRVVAVGLIEGKDYYFDINNYVILKDDVTGTDVEIIEKTEARAWSKETGLAIDSSQLEVRDNGGYKAVVGDYTVKVSVKGATDEKDVVSAIAKVVNGHVIEEGSEYTLVASNLVMSVDEVKALADNDELISLSDAQAWKLDDLSAGTVKLDSTTLEAKVGTYEATFSVEEESATKVTTTIKVIDKDVIERGENYTIAANNIVMTVDEAKAISDNNELITLSKAEAIKQKDMSAGTVKLDSTTFKAEAGTYEAVLSVGEEPATKATIKIKVISGHVIEHGDEYTIVASNLVMTVDEAKAITSNNELITLSKAEAVKRKDLSAGTVKLDSTTFATAAGTYTATFSVEEEPATKAVITIKVVEKDELEDGDDYAIGANNFTVRKGEVASLTNDKIIELAKAEGWKLSNLSSVEVAVDEKSIGTDTESTSYFVRFKIVDKPSKTVTVKVRVVEGNGPKIDFETPVSLNVGDTFDPKENVTATDEEDGDLIDKLNIEGTVDTNTKGVYRLVYSVKDSDGNEDVRVRVVVVGLYVGEEYIFDINNYVILKDDVKATDAEILKNTGAKAWYVKSGLQVDSSQLEVRDNGGYKAEVGDYTVKVSVKGATNDKDVVSATAKVVNGHVIEEGSEYTLVASNLVMSVDEVKALANNDELVGLSKAQAWKLSDLSAADVKLDNTTLEAKVGTYEATFSVKEESATKVTTTIQVIDKDVIERGDNYTIAANNIVMTVDEAKAIADNNELITLSDAQAIKQKDMSAGTVKLDSTTFKAEAGTYEAVLSVNEEPATKVTIQIKVINGDVIEHGDEYTIVASNLIMTVDEAKAIADNDELITLSKAEAIKRKDMSAGTVKLESTTFKAQEGDYTAKFSVEEEPGTTATIQIKVVNGHVIEHGEKYTIVANNLVLTTEEAKTVLADKDSLITLSDAQAWERKTITEGTVKLDSTTLGITEGTYEAVFSVEEEPKTTATIQIKVVNKDELETGDDYAIGANNFSIRKGQVDTITDDELILAAKAEAWKLKDLSNADVEVQSKLIGDDTESTDYYVIFNVVDKPSKTVKVKVRITDGNAPEIDFETPLYLDLNDSFDPKADVTVWDEEDGDLIDDLEITGVVDTSKKDVYRLVYSVKDSDGNKTERVRVVVVGLYIGNEYAFDIKNYVILKDDVTGTDKEIIEKSEVRAWSMKTGLPIQSSLLEVRDNGGYKAEVGEYTAKVSVIGATDAKDVISTRAKVVDGDVISEGDNYTIVANNIVMTLDEAEALADNNALIDLAKARAWKLEDLSEATVKLESTTFKKEIGYYTAVFCVNDDENVKVAISIKVDEGDVIEHGDEYTIVASNIVMTVDEAKAIKSNHELISLAKARAYKRKDMTSGTVMLEDTTFKAEEGDYTATFYVDQEQTTKATVKIKVVKGDVITHGDKYTIVGSNIVMTVDEVNAMNNNDDLITLSNVQAFKRKEMTSADVKLDSTTLEAKVGDYEATFSVVDEPKTKAKVKIKVIDKDVIEHGDKYTIAANNLVMTLDEAKAIKDNNELITLAQAEAYKRKDMSAGTVQLDSTTFDAKAGEYTAVFSVEEEPATKATIKIRVIDGDIIEHGDKYTIVASNIVMTVDEANALANNNELIGVAKVEAYKRKDMSTATVQLDSTTFEAKVGDYEATFSVVDEPTTKATVMIKVIDKDVIEHGDDYTIAANNLVMSVDEVKALTNNDELIALAQAEAYKRKDMSAGTVQLDSTTLVAEAGDYTAVFSVEEEPATKATIKIKVVNGDVIEHGDKYTIVGNNVVMTLDEARAMADNNDLITLSSTKAYKRKDMSEAAVQLDSTSFEVKVGDYEATFSVVDEPTTKATVKIKVVNGDVIEHGDEYTIVASNIVISEQDAQAVETSDDLINLAKAQAYKRKDMSEGTVQLDETTFEAVAGDYTATFSVVEEPKTKATVKIKVVSKDVIVEGDRYFIGANNITINAQTASTITDEELITLSDAEAWLKKDLSSAEVAVQSHTVKGEAGEYEATFYVVDEPTTTCTITVTVSKTALVISANDFSIKNEDATNLDAATSKALSNVKVDVDSRSRVALPTVDDVVVEEAHLSEIQKAPAKGGEYDLRFSVTHEGEEYEVIVKVTVNPKDAKPSIAVPTAPSGPGVTTGDTTDKATLLALFMIALSAIIVVKRRRDEEEA